MVILISPRDNDDGTTQLSVRETHPSSYMLKIDSFSFLVEMLEKLYADSFESEMFEAFGHKWKLHLYPSGDKERDGEGHISMYLTIENTDGMSPAWEILADYKFFVLDEIRDQYLFLEDAAKRPRRFREGKKEWGLARMLSRADFEDAANGYLVKDKCVFGVEIFVYNYTGNGECLAKPEKLIDDSTYTWKVNCSTLTDASCFSPIFTLGNYNWKINLRVEGKCLSAFLFLDDSSTVSTVYAEFMLSIKDQKHSKHVVFQDNYMFSLLLGSSWGWTDFLPLNDIQDNSKGFLVNDTLIIEAEITRTSALKCFSNV